MTIVVATVVCRELLYKWFNSVTLIGLDRTPRVCAPTDILGNFVKGTFVGAERCVLQFIDVRAELAKLVKQTTRRKLWIHLIGDSDTRGLVLALMRLLYPPLQHAITVEEICLAYSNYDEETGECEGTLNGTEMSRIDYAHFQFELTYSELRAVKHYARGGFVSDPKNRTDLFENVYENYGLRISYGFEGADGEYEYIQALKSWSRKQCDHVPDGFYLNLGSMVLRRNRIYQRLQFLVSH